MAPRSSWKGFLKLSVVSVPVKAYTATSSESNEIRFNQLHAECNSRIQYKKSCPIHGEMNASDIVSGYEYAKGQYVIVNTDELEKLRTEDDKAIKIDTFIPTSTVDPIYHSGRTYYLVPDGPVGQKPYALLQKGMVEENRHAIAQVVLHGREQLVLLRPVGKLIAMTILSYEPQITKTSTFDPEVPEVPTTKEEQGLVKTLITAATIKDFEYAKYKDVYTEKLTQLVEAKVAGQEIVAQPPVEQAQVINLMDALRQSVANLSGGKETKQEKPPRKMAPSTGGRAKELRKKSS